MRTICLPKYVAANEGMLKKDNCVRPSLAAAFWAGHFCGRGLRDSAFVKCTCFYYMWVWYKLCLLMCTLTTYSYGKSFDIFKVEELLFCLAFRKAQTVLIRF